MNAYDESTDVGLNAADFLGNYLKKEDLEGEAAVTLVAVRAETIPGSSRQKLIAEFREWEKPLILNKTNIKRLCRIFGSNNTAHWRGAVTLYVDDNVEYAGMPVGGIRIKPATQNGGGMASRGERQRADTDVPF